MFSIFKNTDYFEPSNHQCIGKIVSDTFKNIKISPIWADSGLNESHVISKSPIQKPTNARPIQTKKRQIQHFRYNGKFSDFLVTRLSL